MRIEWAEPPDDIGVTRYEVYRDGVLLRRTPLAYLEDAGLPPDSEHGYFVVARDGSVNRSAPSATVTVRTLPGEQDLANGGFELGLLEPLAWSPVSLEGEAVLRWAPAGDGRNGSRCIVIESTAPTHAHWRQDLTGLVPDGRYLLSAWVKGQDVHGAPPDAPTAFVRVLGACEDTLPLLADGSVAAWGGNQHGQTDVPSGLRHARVVAAGMMSSFALLGTQPPTCRAPVLDPGLASGRFHITARCRPGDPTFLLSARSLHHPLWNVVTGAVTREPAVALADPDPLSDQRYYAASRSP